jgi:hypothetical protein
MIIPLYKIVEYVKIEEQKKHTRDKNRPYIRGGTYRDFLKPATKEYGCGNVVPKDVLAALEVAENSGMIMGHSPCVFIPGRRGGAKRYVVTEVTE